MNKPPVRPGAAVRPGAPRPSQPGLKGGAGAPAPAADGKPPVRPKWYKRKYLVYPKFQTTLILLNATVTVLLFGMVIFFVVRSHLYLENLVQQTRLPAQNLFIQLLTEQLRTLLIYMFIALGASVVVMATFTLIISHKMAGPIIRLRNLFNQISKNGDFPEPLKFRDGDYFQDLPPAINQAFNALKKKWSR